MSPGAVYKPVVRTTFNIDGDVTSFDAAGFRAALLSRFKTAEDVAIDVSAASITVKATLIMSNEADAESAANVIMSTPTSTMESEWFASVNGGSGLTIRGRPSATVVRAVLEAPSPPPPPAPSPLLPPAWAFVVDMRLVLGLGIAGAVVIVACIGLCMWRRRETNETIAAREKAREQARADARAEARAEVRTAVEALQQTTSPGRFNSPFASSSAWSSTGSATMPHSVLTPALAGTRNGSSGRVELALSSTLQDVLNYAVEESEAVTERQVTEEARDKHVGLHESLKRVEMDGLVLHLTPSLSHEASRRTMTPSASTPTAPLAMQLSMPPPVPLPAPADHNSEVPQHPLPPMARHAPVHSPPTFSPPVDPTSGALRSERNADDNVRATSALVAAVGLDSAVRWARSINSQEGHSAAVQQRYHEEDLYIDEDHDMVAQGNDFSSDDVTSEEYSTFFV